MLKVEMTTGNDAFQSDPGTEMARILRDLADKIEGSVLPGDWGSFPLRDVNGNRVGKALISQCLSGCLLEDGHSDINCLFA